MKNDYLKFVATFLLFYLHFTTSFSQTVTTQTFAEGRISYENQAEKRGAFHLSINPETQTMTIIPLSPDFQGIKSLSVCSSRVGDSTDTIICTTNFIVPWHPDSRHEVPLPSELFECVGELESYSWRIVWMMEKTEVILKKTITHHLFPTVNTRETLNPK